MRIDTNTGLLESARQVYSPNCDERSEGEQISLLVIHNISLPPAEYGGCWIDALFTNTLDPDAHPYFQTIAGQRVSAHLLVRRDGEVVQYVPFHRRAWHAGRSCFQGRVGCNDFSIGIELEGCDEQPYEDVQYQHLITLTRSLMVSYPAIMPERIVGHSDIAPGRKTDPGPAFDWKRYLDAVRECGCKI